MNNIHPCTRVGNSYEKVQKYGGESRDTVGGKNTRQSYGFTFLLVNIARLITPSGKTKSAFLKDQAETNNSMFMGVTETWLHSDILDTEVTHDCPGFNIYRCDRSGGRKGGGVALYLKEDLTGDVLATFANNVCELIIVKIHQLDTVVCVAYRPPDTRHSEFSGLLRCLDETLSGLTSPVPSVVLMGDFNFPESSMTWSCSQEGLLAPVVAKHREEETLGGKQDRLQAQQLVDLVDKYCLIQEVNLPTHGREILDLVFSNNCTLVSGVAVEDWSTFTDHRLVIVNTSYQQSKHLDTVEEQFLCETGRRYSSLDFFKAPWEEINTKLESVNWDQMEEIANSSSTDALVYFHEKVLAILEELVPQKRKKCKSKPKMHRMRRLLWKRLGKVKKSLKSSKSVEKIAETLKNIWQLESELSADYKAINKIEEDEAVLRMKSNPKSFFSFAKSRQRTKVKIGPFLDKDGQPNPSADFSAESLRKQYDSVFAHPRQEWAVSNFPLHFNVSDGEESVIQDIEFSPADIEKACGELRGEAAAGPDGVPASFLKKCKKHLSKPLYILWRSSLDKGSIPPELLLVLICPVHKGGSRSIPKNYRPVALTSHLIKVFERLVRKALVSHIEKNNILPDGQHGSRAMRSTLTQLLSHWDNILDGLENGIGVDCVYLDFSKAFDKVETGVLLHKLRDARVLGKLGCWIASFLDSSGRQQAVAVEGRISALSPVVSGVPQGTVLGPVLFLLHIADIASGVATSTTVSSYVDDTRANRCISDPAVDCPALQDDLSSIYSWAEKVNMLFNCDKFECLRFWPSREGKPSYQYQSPDWTIIEEKAHLRDLGVEIDSDLSFSVHIQQTVTAANRLIGWSLRTFRRRSQAVMMTIWRTLIQTKLDYCSQLWSPCDQASIGKLESVARQFTSQISGLENKDYWKRLSYLKCTRKNVVVNNTRSSLSGRPCKDLCKDTP